MKPHEERSEMTDADLPAQLGAANLKTMTPEQIVEAYDKGQFDDLLTAKQEVNE